MKSLDQQPEELIEGQLINHKSGYEKKISQNATGKKSFILEGSFQIFYKI